MLLRLPRSSPAKTLLLLSHPLIQPAQIPTVRDHVVHNKCFSGFCDGYTHTFTHLFVLLSVVAAVVSLNDSDELSTSSSEEEEDDEDEEEAEEEEDSGSEVEIIEEVQGNGSLPALQPSSVFEQPGLSHFLPSITEQQAAELSLMTPSTEIKVSPKTIREKCKFHIIKRIYLFILYI